MTIGGDNFIARMKNLAFGCSSDVATATTIRAADFTLTQTVASAINSLEAMRVTLLSAVKLGDWANAIVGKIDFSTAGYVTGLAAPICAEIDMPAGSVVGGHGTYACYEAEFNCPTSYVGGGVPLAFFALNAWGAEVAQFDDSAYLFILTGVTSGAGHIWYDNQKSAPAVEEFIRVKTPSGVRYLGLYNANA